LPEDVGRVCEPSKPVEGGDVRCHIIRWIRMAHCKRGPARCEKCREMDVERPCLLDICPPEGGLMQRRLIEVEVEGEVVWREFDVVKVFEDEEVARAYAGERGITDVEL
jgi:hypothetical protein